MKQTDDIQVSHPLKTKSASMPTVAKEIITLANDSRTSIAHLSSVLLKDSMLTKSILKRANSPYYGFSKKINTLDFAIVLLGFDVLKETVSGLLISSALRRMVNAMFRFEEFWNHSLSCGVVATYLAEKSNNCAPEDACLAGLLHDIGYVVLHQYANEDQAVTAKKMERQMLRNIESIVGVTHSEAGGWIAERWQLKPEVIEAIRYHHQPESATINPRLTATVHVADILCRRLGIGSDLHDEAETYSPTALTLANFDEATLDPSEVKNRCARLLSDLGGADSFAGLVRAIRARFIEAIAGLPEKQKIIIALYFHEGLTFEEIGHVLTMDETAINALYADALSALRSILWNTP